MVTILFSFSF